MGWSINVRKRIDDHAKHTSSTYVMGLFEACAEHLFPSRYSVEGYPVVRITEPFLADLAEAAISRLACSYVTWGWGFNPTVAGASVHGVNSLPIIQLGLSKNERESWTTL